MNDRHREKSIIPMLIFWSLILHFISFCQCGDITAAAFGSISPGSVPAAFGDFNSDELTDLFVINRQRTLLILLGNPVEPYFRQVSALNCTLTEDNIITSVIPGDFDGDALMDVVVTSRRKHLNADVLLQVYIFWGGLDNLNCSANPVFEMKDEPLAIDFNRDMIIDLFGVNDKGTRGFWIFQKNRTFNFRPMLNYTSVPLRVPHSHAFFDMNNDNSPDLYLTAEHGFEVHLWNNDILDFVHDRNISFPEDKEVKRVDQLGQSLFLDVEVADKTDHVVPVCLDGTNTNNNGGCSKSAIYVNSLDKWYKVYEFDQYNFVTDSYYYLDTITMRAGDYNMDGYPDILVTMRENGNGEFKTILLINKECIGDCHEGFNRTFNIVTDAFQSSNSYTIMGVFYDFQQDGVIDVIFVHYDKTDGSLYNMSAYKNSLDYDANFIKVMVITGLINSESTDSKRTFFGTKRHTFGTNLPGPKISYKTTTQEGVPRSGLSNQLAQSAHFAMYLPYTIFGLGRTPNFVEDLTVGMFNASHTWNQIIPNSQLVVIPYPPQSPGKWRAQLFVTPSKIILQSVLALLGTCLVILIIIGLLHLKEKREDRVEKLEEAHRFHFDAM